MSSKAKKIDFSYKVSAKGKDIAPLHKDGFFTIPGEPTEQQIRDQLIERIKNEYHDYLVENGIELDVEACIEMEVNASDVVMDLKLKS